MEPERLQEIARCLFRESSDAFLIFEPRDRRVIDLNPAALRLSGFDRKEALGLPLEELLVAEDPEALDRLVEAFRKTGLFHSREGYGLRRRQGSPLPVNASVSRIHTEPEPLGLLVLRDVSEQRRAQEVLDRFFRLSPALFAIITPDGRFAKVNDAWEEVLGYPAEALRARPAVEFLGQAAIPGEPSRFQVPCRHADGGERWISWSTAAVEGSTYAVGLDVTEARQAAELRQARDTADQANRAKGLFLARMSHELRTPLTAILGLVDVLLGDPDFGRVAPERAEDVRTIQSNGRHLLQLINNILDLSKIEEGKLEIELAPCDPSQVVSEVVELLRNRAEQKGVGLSTASAPGVPARVLTDPLRLRQILLNLVGNAIKFTDRGEVRVGLAVRREPSDAPSLRIDVADTGLGLTQEQVETLFQEFQQVHPGPKHRPGGTGLGLPICRQLAEALGGRIDVESHPGQGSLFRLVLPIVEVAPDSMSASAPERPERPAPPLAKALATTSTPRRVLLAEDNADNRHAIALRLQQLGFQPHLACNGREAIDEALGSDRPFDVILMDMQMPVVDGYEATRILRSQGYHAPIIALTAFAMAEDRQECLDLGCDEHIIKPVDWDYLLHVIAKLTGTLPVPG